MAEENDIQPVQERFEDMRILDELKTSYLNYAMSVIVSRALPAYSRGDERSEPRTAQQAQKMCQDRG